MFTVCSWEKTSLPSEIYPVTQQSPTFLAPGTGLVEENFSMNWGWGVVSRWFKHITFIVFFLLLLYQPHLRPSGIKSQRLGTPPLIVFWGGNVGRNSLKVYIFENVFNVLLRSLFHVSFRLTNTFPQHGESIYLTVFSVFCQSGKWKFSTVLSHQLDCLVNLYLW